MKYFSVKIEWIIIDIINQYKNLVCAILETHALCILSYTVLLQYCLYNNNETFLYYDICAMQVVTIIMIVQSQK